MCSLRFLLHACNSRDHNKPPSNKLRLKISAGWLFTTHKRWNTKAALNFYMLKTQLLKLLTRWEEPFCSLKLHAFHICISVFSIFFTRSFNNQKRLPELWCFNNSFWISRKFSRQPRVISNRRSNAALLANWNGNKAFFRWSWHSHEVTLDSVYVTKEEFENAEPLENALQFKPQESENAGFSF